MKVSQENRKKARLAQAKKLEQIKKQEQATAELLSGVDSLEEMHRTIGESVNKLKELGARVSELAELTGLSSTQLNRFAKLAKDGSPKESSRSVDEQPASTENGGTLQE